MPKAAAGRGEKATAANAVIPKVTPIVRIALAAYEALKVGHLKDQNNLQRALRAIGSYGRGQNAQAASARVYLAVIASRMSAFGGKADIGWTHLNVCF